MSTEKMEPVAALDNIKAALEAGPTEGPWFPVEDKTKRSCINTNKHGAGYWIAECNYYAGDGLGSNLDPIKKNAAFIAACNPSAIRELLAYVESLERDAARYRWLRAALTDPKGVSHWFCLVRESVELDAAIDAAMEQTK